MKSQLSGVTAHSRSCDQHEKFELYSGSPLWRPFGGCRFIGSAGKRLTPTDTTTWSRKLNQSVD